jgi:SAM-dependent methyltransferase
MADSSFKLWACPSSGRPIQDDGQEFKLVSAEDVDNGFDQLKYPKVGGIPWLFPDPKHVLSHWRERIEMLLQTRAHEIEELKQSQKSSESKLAKQRIENLRQSKILQLELLKKILEPLKSGKKLSLAKIQALGYKLPFNQGLLGYFPNMARDWGISHTGLENENRILFEATKHFLPEEWTSTPNQTAIHIAVLGCGAGRLPYDLAKLFPKSKVVAIDINPLLLFTAKRMNSGEKLSGIFPAFSPKDRMNPALEIQLSAPAGPAENLEFAFADVYALPFQCGSFDLVVTPWLVDILPRKFSHLTSSLAQVSKPYGKWINLGAWFFNFQNEDENISLEEAEEIGQKTGWQPQGSQLFETPYLQTDIDSHRRFETMTGFIWERTAEPVRYDSIWRFADKAEWLLDPNLPIPRLPAFQQSIESLSTMTWVLSQVDGKRSLNELTSILSTSSGLQPEAARDALDSFFERYLKDRTFRERT